QIAAPQRTVRSQRYLLDFRSDGGRKVRGTHVIRTPRSVARLEVVKVSQLGKHLGRRKSAHFSELGRVENTARHFSSHDETLAQRSIVERQRQLEGARQIIVRHFSSDTGHSNRRTLRVRL